MLYWLDSEFIDTGSLIDLISIGILSGDGRELYLQSCQFNPQQANEWVEENVFPSLVPCPYPLHREDWLIRDVLRIHLCGKCIPTMNEPERHRCLWQTRKQIADEVRRFLDPGIYGKPEIWGFCSAYDYVALCQLFGTMMDLPAHWPHYIRDVQQVMDAHGITDNMLPKQEGHLHNAIEDARHIKKIWETVCQ